MLEGKVYHKALETYWNYRKVKAEVGEDLWDMLLNNANRDIIDIAEKGFVDFGKTGSVDKSIKIVEKALSFYRDDLPDYSPVIIEQSWKGECWDLNGEILPVPLKVKYDLVSEGDTLDIVDHKLVTSFKDEIEGDAGFELQAACSFFTVWAQFQKQPARMIYDQVKKSKNSDGTPQRRTFIIEFKDTNGNPAPCLYRFLEVYRRIVMELSGKPLMDENGVMKFLPNPFSFFGASDSWNDFCLEVEGGQPLSKEAIQELKRKSEEIEPAELE